MEVMCGGAGPGISDTRDRGDHPNRARNTADRLAAATESQYDRPMASTVVPTAPIRLPLTQLKRGDRAVVEFDASEVVPTGLSAEDREILRAMGLDERRAFTVCRAGRGGPCIIQVEATRLGLSPELARRIMTRPCGCAEDACCAPDATGTPATGSATPADR